MLPKHVAGQILVNYKSNAKKERTRFKKHNSPVLTTSATSFKNPVSLYPLLSRPS
ncbi:hypothetical protein Hanom_Chr06g00481141 [Helianthus anomalus]